MPKIEIQVSAQARLDVLAAEAAGASRSQAARWIEDGLCMVDGVVQRKTSFKAPAGAMLCVEVPEAVGYRDEKYFGKLFRQHAGCTLREFQRRNHLKGETL